MGGDRLVEEDGVGLDVDFVDYGEEDVVLQVLTYAWEVRDYADVVLVWYSGWTDARYHKQLG